LKVVTGRSSLVVVAAGWSAAVRDLTPGRAAVSKWKIWDKETGK